MSEARLMLRLKSARLLNDYMARNGIQSAYELARRANLHVGIVGHLVAGRRDRCAPATAYALEGVLQVKPGDLFVPEVLSSADNPQTKTSAA